MIASLCFYSNRRWRLLSRINMQHFQLSVEKSADFGDHVSSCIFDGLCVEICDRIIAFFLGVRFFLRYAHIVNKSLCPAAGKILCSGPFHAEAVRVFWRRSPAVCTVCGGEGGQGYP